MTLPLKPRRLNNVFKTLLDVFSYLGHVIPNVIHLPKCNNLVANKPIIDERTSDPDLHECLTPIVPTYPGSTTKMTSMISPKNNGNHRKKTTSMQTNIAKWLRMPNYRQQLASPTSSNISTPSRTNRLGLPGLQFCQPCSLFVFIIVSLLFLVFF